MIINPVPPNVKAALEVCDQITGVMIGIAATITKKIDPTTVTLFKTVLMNFSVSKPVLTPGIDQPFFFKSLLILCASICKLE